jgi:hypothetical protein
MRYPWANTTELERAPRARAHTLRAHAARQIDEAAGMREHGTGHSASECLGQDTAQCSVSALESARDNLAVGVEGVTSPGKLPRLVK